MTERICSINQCDSPTVAHGLCNKHYRRLRRTGRLDRPSDEERFYSHVTESVDGCWIFDRVNAKGYAAFNVAGRPVEGHQWNYRFLVGDVPECLILDHLCRVRNCVNPGHLEPVPHRINILRGFGPAAVNARKTQCVNGHPFTRANTYVTPDGRRQCRTCLRARSDKHRRRS